MSEPAQNQPSDGQGAPLVQEADVVEALRSVYDPEIPVNIYDLGLIYEIVVGPDNSVFVRMTLTAPNCPVADILPAQVESRVRVAGRQSAAFVRRRVGAIGMVL